MKPPDRAPSPLGRIEILRADVALCWNCDGKSTLIARFLLDQVVTRQAKPGRLRWRLLKSRPCKARSHAP
jgi:hypothetical protein